MLPKLLNLSFKNNQKLFLPVLLILSGCSSSNSFLSDGMSDNAKIEAKRWAKMWAEKPVVIDPIKMNSSNPPSQNTTDGKIEQQKVRMTNIESGLQQLIQQQQVLRNNINSFRQEIKKETAPPARQTAAPARPAQNVAPVNIVQPTTSSFGIHLASYKLRENIIPGLNTIRRLLPDTIRSKQARIATLDISGTEYYRLILGPYKNRTEASTDCGIIMQNFDFCEIIDFMGEEIE